MKTKQLPPPSEEELKAFSSSTKVLPPPSEEDISKFTPSKLDEVSAIAQKVSDPIGEGMYDASLGAIQGATFDLADEAEGAGRTGLAALKSVLGTGEGFNPSTDLVKKYNEFKKLSNQKYEDAQKRSPYLYGGGELAGAVFSPLTLGAGGMVAKGVEATLPGLTQTGVKAAFNACGKSAAAKAILEHAAKDALVNAPLGGLFAAGSSKNNLTDSPEALKEDVIHGAETGGVIGASMSVAGNTIPAAWNAGTSVVNKAKNKVLDENPYFREIAQAFDFGNKGQNIAKPSVSTAIRAEAPKDAENLISTFKKADDLYGKQIGDSVTDATKQGVEVSIDDPLMASLKKLQKYKELNPSFEFPKSIEEMYSKMVDNRVLTPEEARTFVTEGRGLLKTIRSDNTIPNQIKEAVSDVTSGVRNKLGEAIPGYNEASANFGKTRDIGINQVLRGGISPEQASRTIGVPQVGEYALGTGKNGEALIDQDLLTKVKHFIETATGSGGIKQGESGAAFEYLKQNLPKLEQTNPEAFKAMGIDSKSLIDSIRNSADKQSMIMRYLRVNPNESHSVAGEKAIASAGGILGGITDVTGRVFNGPGLANKVGLINKGIVQPAVKFTKKVLYDMPVGASKSFSDHLKSLNSPWANSYAEGLDRAITNGDQVGKNAVMFSIMQNKSAKKALGIEEKSDGSK